MNKIKILFIIIFSIVFFDGYTQTKGCEKELLEYLNNMENKFLNRNVKDVYQMKYSVTTHFSDELKPSISNTEVFTGQNKLLVKSSQMEVYADTENIFVVIPMQNKIYWNAYNPEVFKQMDSYKKLLDIQRLLLQSAERIDCSIFKGQSRIEIKPNSKFRKTAKISKQIILLDNKLKKVKKVTNIFGVNSRIKKQEVYYHIINYTSNKKILPSISYFFKGGKLKNKFKNYSIIDNR